MEHIISNAHKNVENIGNGLILIFDGFQLVLFGTKHISFYLILTAETQMVLCVKMVLQFC